MLSKLEKTLLLVALFHDIGKFEQRATSEKERLKHQEYSAGFINKIFGDELLSEIVYHHHIEDLLNSKLSGENRILAEILCEADNLASGERQPDPNVNFQQPLESIFSKVDYGRNNQTTFFQDICDLDYRRYIFPISEKDFKLELLENKYFKWWDCFQKEILAVSNKDEIETLFHILKKYLWCVPSSSYKTRSDVSLFEHSKLTAAIAISLFRFLLEKSDNKIENIKDISNRQENRYLLVLGDITGIQSFIYNIGHKGAAKALKGRSFFLNQMLENIAFYFLNKLELPITNLIYASGGKFYLLIPNTIKTNSVLDDLQKEVERALFYVYNGSLGIIIGKIELNGKDLEYDKQGKMHPISEKWDLLNKIVEREKKRKLSKNWGYYLFEPTNTDGEIIKCSFTGVPIIRREIIEKKQTNTSIESLDENSPVKFLKHSFDGEIFYQLFDDEGNLTEDYITKEQFYSQKIGNDLKKRFKTLVYQDIIEGYSVLDLNSFYLSDDLDYKNNYGAKEARQFLINDFNINSLKGETNKGFKFYGGDWRLKGTFDEVSESGVGISRMGVLRLDVDNLGLIFKEGFGKFATFGRIVQLSSMLDFFFSNYLNKIKHFSWDPIKGLSEKRDEFYYKVDELLEIIYSGGDDVFIVGHWSILPDIALWINKSFRQFTAFNKNFTISAGISLFDTKYPIYKAANEAGEFEETVKRKLRKNRIEGINSVKDGICFLDKNTPVSWDDFSVIRNWVKKFYSWIRTEKHTDKEKTKRISKGLISRIYNIYYEYVEGDCKNWSKWRWRAAYSLSRLANQYKEPFEKEIKEFAAEMFTSTKTEQELVQLLYIIATWTDLLTRKEE